MKVEKYEANIDRNSNIKIYLEDLWEKIKYYRYSYLLIAPFMILFFIFVIVPVISSLILSFTYFNMLQFPQWRGWLNYQRIFLDDDIFLIAVKNTLIFAFLTGPISYLLCFIFAWFVNELPPKIRAFMTLIFYAPSISGNIFFIWAFIFSSDAYGLVNGFLMSWGIIREPVQWLQDPKWNMDVIILVQLWLSLGVGFLAFIAGFQTVDPSLYEAGAIDGIRNRFQELFFITIPQMKGQLLFGAVMQIAGSFAVGAVPMALGGFPSTNYSLHTVIAHIYDYGNIRYEMGYASAISTLLTLSMIITNNIITRLLKTD